MAVANRVVLRNSESLELYKKIKEGFKQIRISQYFLLFIFFF